jgi:hypothetical protein
MDDDSQGLSRGERAVVAWGVGLIVGVLLFLTAGPCLGCTAAFLILGLLGGMSRAKGRNAQRVARQPIPTLAFPTEAAASEGLIRLAPGQELMVCHPATTQVEVPDGVRLQILEANGEYVRVRAVVDE